MKLTKYITTACIAALFTGCDYLDFDETTGMTKEEMYSYFRQRNKPVYFCLLSITTRLRCNRRRAKGCRNRQRCIHLESKQRI